MIDIHCHMLPGIDDGPEGLDVSLAMARLAVANGITETVVTPHIHVGRYANTRESLGKATRDTNGRLRGRHALFLCSSSISARRPMRWRYDSISARRSASSAMRASSFSNACKTTALPCA